MKALCEKDGGIRVYEVRENVHGIFHVTEQPYWQNREGCQATMCLNVLIHYGYSFYQTDVRRDRYRLNKAEQFITAFKHQNRWIKEPFPRRAEVEQMLKNGNVDDWGKYEFWVDNVGATYCRRRLAIGRQEKFIRFHREKFAKRLDFSLDLCLAARKLNEITARYEIRNVENHSGITDKGGNDITILEFGHEFIDRTEGAVLASRKSYRQTIHGKSALEQSPSKGCASGDYLNWDKVFVPAKTPRTPND